MRPAIKSDKQKLINIMVQSYYSNPTLLYLCRKLKNREKYIAHIASYMFDFAYRRNGVFLSSNEMGVTVCFQYNYRKPDLYDYYLKLKMAFSAFKWSKLSEINRHTSYVNSFRPKDGNYLYFWLYGVLPEEEPRVSAREMGFHILKLANEKGLSIYAETTIEQNKRVYERYGMEVYHFWYNPESKLPTWFLRTPLKS